MEFNGGQLRFVSFRIQRSCPRSSWVDCLLPIASHFATGKPVQRSFAVSHVSLKTSHGSQDGLKGGSLPDRAAQTTNELQWLKFDIILLISRRLFMAGVDKFGFQVSRIKEHCQSHSTPRPTSAPRYTFITSVFRIPVITSGDCHARGTWDSSPTCSVPRLHRTTV